MVSRHLALAAALLCASMAFAQKPEADLTSQVFSAIDREDLAALQAAFREGASPDAPDSHGMPPIVAAAKQGNRRICLAVADAGANVNVSPNGGMTALMWGVFNKQKECVQVLLAHHVNLDQTDSAGRTALFEAEANQDQQMMKLLIDAGANLQATNRDGFTVLGDASQRNVYDTVQFLRRAGAKFGSDTEELFAAAASGDAVHLREMLEAHRGDPNHRSIYGGSALSAAAQKGNTVIVRVLIEYGADLNVLDNNHQTPLYYAVVSKHLSTVEALLDAGADPHIESPGHRSLLVTQAAWLDDAKLTRRLIAAGLDVNEADSYGETPLIAAVHTLRRDNARALLEAGAEPKLRDKRGNTALDYAQKHDRELAVLLSDHR